MIDIRLIRESPELVRKNLERRRDPQAMKNLDVLVRKDSQWRASLKRLESLRKRRNETNEAIARSKREGKPVKNEIGDMKALSEKIRKLEAETEKLRAESRSLLMAIPNLLHESVPPGRDDTENREVRKWGRIPGLGNPRNHLDILKGLGLIEDERASRASGSGFFYMKEGLVLLDMAIQRYAIDFLRKRGYTLVYPPLLLKRKPYEGVTDLGDFEDVMYRIEGEDLYLIATSEHPMAAMFMDEVLDKRDLPIKLCGLSPCFRREVGSHGKYTKGLFRMHQFNKIEQFVFSLPGDSWKLHEELQKNSEMLYQGLALAHRVVNVCTGDIGTIASKKYDTEVWMSDGQYREAGSNSNCTDYQSRRLNIRYREGEGRPPSGLVHTLNNTALATSRTILAIIEQNQQRDGSVPIPRALWPYMDGIKKLEKKA